MSELAQGLAPFVRWDSVILAQRLRCRAADVWFTHFPLLGNELQYVLAFPFLTWFTSFATATRFALAGAVSCFVANALKDIFKLPRPPLKFHVGAGGTSHELIAQQHGFPSTHSAHALVLSWVVASEFALPRQWVVAHTIHVCFSRLYMGVHSLADIVGGLVVGAVCVCAYVAAGAHIDAIGAGLTLASWGLALTLLHPEPRASNSAYTEACKFVGLHIGAVAARSTGPWWPPAGARAALAQAQGPGAASAALAAAPPWGTLLLGEFLVGLVALGLFRQALSALAKRAVRALPAGGGAAEAAEVARHVIVTALAAWWVVAVHPSRLLGAAGL